MVKLQVTKFKRSICILMIGLLIQGMIPITGFAVETWGTIVFDGPNTFINGGTNPIEMGAVVKDGYNQNGYLAGGYAEDNINVTEINEIDIQIFASSDGITSTGILVYLNEGAAMVDVLTPNRPDLNIYNYLVIESIDENGEQAEFNLISLNIDNINMVDDYVFIEGWRDGAAVAAKVQLNLDGGGNPTNFNTGNGITSGFGNVDKVLIYRADTNTDITVGLGNIAIGPPVIPLETPPVLTADTTSNDVDSDLEITFAEDAAFRAAITGITYNGNTLTASQYDITQAGKIILKPSVAGNVYLRTPGTADVEITAAGYNNSSVSQTINAGEVASLTVTTQPEVGSASGDSFTTQPIVKLKDQYGNYCTTGVSATANVVATAKSETGSWSIDGTITKAAIAGTATFTDLTCDLVTVGNGSITFISGIKTIDSSEFTIPQKSAKTLTADTTSNDVDSNLEITFASDATFEGAITGVSYDGNALVATNQYTISSGKITLIPSAEDNAYLHVPKTANIVITATGYNNSSVSQTLDAGSVDSLEITTQPVVGTASGDAFGTQPVVKLKDKFSNYCTTGVSSAANITATAKAGTGSWSIGGTITKAAIAGTVTFTDLTCDLLTAGNGSITFTSGIKTIDSSEFTLPNKSAKVLTADTTSNDIDNNLEITFAPDATFEGAITGVSYDGNALVATNQYTISSGKITLIPSAEDNAYLHVPKTANIVITATGYNNSSVSQTLNAGSVDSLEITTQPVVGTASGDAFGTQPVVKLKDKFANYCTTGVSSAANITATAKAGTGSWSIGGTITKAAIAGTAIFTDLTCDLVTVGNGSITFTSGIKTIESSVFNIPLAGIDGLAADTTSNDVDHDIELTFTEDATFRTNITSITYGGNSLTTSQYDVTQVGKIILKPSIADNLYLRTPGTENIEIIASGYANAVISQTINAGTVEILEVTTQPVVGAASGNAFGTQPVIKLKDQFGNYCTTGVSSAANITATAKAGTGSWSIGGTITKAAIVGTATFTDLTCDLLTAGNGSITFISGIKTIDSSTFTIPNKSAKVLTADTTSNDIDNNLEITFTPDATFEGAITGVSYDGNILDSSQYTVSSGKVTLKPSVTGNTYLRIPGTANVVITAAGYNNSSVSQTLNAGSVASLEITTQPVPGSASGDAFGTQPVVKLKDQYGNYCTTGISATANVVATVHAGTGSWNIAGTTTKVAVAGTVTFTDLKSSIITIGTGTIHFESGVIQVNSQSFNIPEINSNVTSVALTFDKYASSINYKDLEVQVNYNGNTLNNIKNGTTILALGTDYGISGSSIIVKKEFLAKFLLGSVPLTFNFSQGNAPIITISITDSKPVVVVPQPENDKPSTGGNSATTQVVTKQPATQQGADILVNGKKESAGTSVTSKKGTISETLIIVDEKKIEEKLKQEGQGAVVTIPVISSSDVIAGELNGQIIKNMENKEATIKIQTEKASYTLAASQINISDISKQLGNDLNLTDIKVKIEIAKPQSTMLQSVENASQKGNFTVMMEPVDFTVTCTTNEKTVSVTNFNTYVERTVKLPEGIDPNKITTGVVIDEDGAVRHVPTKVIEIDGAYYAHINSLTNSTYAVIWNPKTFEDMENHWAKSYANEMGSRKVISGVDEQNFVANRKVTRAEFAVMIVNALGLKASQENIILNDIQKADWYYGHIVTAIKYKLIDGYDETTFAPNEEVTRQEAMKIIQKALNIAGIKEPSENSLNIEDYKDRSKISSWAEAGVELVMSYGIIEGNDKEIRPLDNLTRAEAAKIIMKMLQTAKLI